MTNAEVSGSYKVDEPKKSNQTENYTIFLFELKTKQNKRKLNWI